MNNTDEFIKLSMGFIQKNLDAAIAKARADAIAVPLNGKQKRALKLLEQMNEYTIRFLNNEITFDQWSTRIVPIANQIEGLSKLIPKFS